MKNQKFLIISIVGIIFLLGAFYWFEYRPSQIRKQCYHSAQIKFQDAVADKINEKIDESSEESREALKNKFGSLEEAKKQLGQLVNKKINTEILEIELVDYMQQQMDYIYQNCLLEKGI